MIAEEEQEIEAHTSDVPSELHSSKVAMMPWVIAKEVEVAPHLRSSPLSASRSASSQPRCTARSDGLLTAQRPVSPIGRRNALKELQEVPSANSWRGSQGVPRSLWPTSSCTFTAFSQDNEKLSLYDTMEGIYTELWQVAECGVPETVSLDRSAEIDLSHEFPPEQREAQIDQAVFYRRRANDDQSEACILQA